ncbi:MGH1-like glycoside hydrolase domain-containing protein [Oryzifoliimicrobium ureilyticus]|uniref:MGH1-like glycoside hydrolase domain-containing protein n=1 Tax=Oryzifoliimicrobium ureilyticus TaxID=3113724 RepID=UPI003075FBEF
MPESLQARVAATVEGQRLQSTNQTNNWRRWGPYLSDRQWGTVREDYSADGDAWEYFTYDEARSRAYRWGEDGIGGITDEGGRWCLAPAFWNGCDTHLKERLFGVTNPQGNHGEDVKEVYHYVDATPTHSYGKMLYRYPHQAFPYEDLVTTSLSRSRLEPEYELVDTGIFEGGYFDITIEHAKAAPDDILMRISVKNFGPSNRKIWIIPQLWARNTWSWDDVGDRPAIEADDHDAVASRQGRPKRRLEVDGPHELFFCENETNIPLLFEGKATGPFKDGVHDYIVKGDRNAVRRAFGTKVAAIVVMELKPLEERCVRVRWRPDANKDQPAFQDFDRILTQRIDEADEFYAIVQSGLDNDARFVHRQAMAGLLWSKQFYHIDVSQWLEGDALQPPPPHARLYGRNKHWQHLNTADVMLMPDKWEYPWFAAWDLAFHAVAIADIDARFAKDQLLLLMREWYMHPNGQLPGYEWEFADANPPVHAWAALQIYRAEKSRGAEPDTDFLERTLHKLLLNFTWWVNRRDEGERNLFQGGFLGLDNISPFNRSEPLPDGATIDQADGTAWMAMYALNLMAMALELAQEKPLYEDLATKFFEHFLSIAGAMSDAEGRGESLWNDEDGFFYDVIRDRDGVASPVRLRSMVGLIPLFAVEVIDKKLLDKVPGFKARMAWFLKHRPKLAALVSRWDEEGAEQTYLLSLLRGHRLKCLLARAFDPAEFLSDFGIRSLSKAHLADPCRVSFADGLIEVAYQPGEAPTGLYGGNSNWRGPIWMPVNYLIVDSINKFDSYFGRDFKVPFPSQSSTMIDLGEAADALASRIVSLFLPNGNNSIPPSLCATGEKGRMESAILFFEYFHGDTGAGLGASHQTGWTALAALLLKQLAERASSQG